MIRGTFYISIIIILCLTLCFNATGTESENYRKLYKQGWENLQSQNWEKALSAFTRVIELNPEDSSAWVNRGVARQNMGDIDGANVDYNHSIGLDPKSHEGFFHRAQLRHIMGNYRGGIEDCTIVIRIIPKDQKYKKRLADAYTIRCEMRERVADLTGANQDWEQAVKTNPIVKRILAKPRPMPSPYWEQSDYIIDDDVIEQGNIKKISYILGKEPMMVKARSAGPIASNYSWTLLHAAVRSKNPKAYEICKELIKNNAEVNAKDSEGNTPLHFAVYRMGRENLPDVVYNGIIDLLLDNGADISSVNLIGATPLHSATVTGAGFFAVEKLIKKGANVNLKTYIEGKYTPLHGAAASGRDDLVEILLKHGANPDLRDARNLTPPEMAKQAGHRDTVKVFKRLSGLKPQVQPVIPEIDIQLLEAARAGDNEQIPQLLSKGASPDAIDSEGYTALMLAAMNSDPEAVKALIDAGANTESEYYRHGATALGLAVEAKRHDIVRVLLDSGANVNARGYNRATKLITAAAQGDKEMARILLDAGADINMCNMHNKSALFAAVQMGHPGMVKLLLDAGADVNIRDFQNKTALMHALEKNHADIVDMIRSVEN